MKTTIDISVILRTPGQKPQVFTDAPPTESADPKKVWPATVAGLEVVMGKMHRVLFPTPEEAAADAEKAKAESDSATHVLPDGSAFATMSLPLPGDHWLFTPPCQEWDSVRDTIADTPHPVLADSFRPHVIAAIRFALRASTRCGQDMNMDPDALVQNAVFALCGPAGKLENSTPGGSQ